MHSLGGEAAGHMTHLGSSSSSNHHIYKLLIYLEHFSGLEEHIDKGWGDSFERECWDWRCFSLSFFFSHAETLYLS